VSKLDRSRINAQPEAAGKHRRSRFSTVMLQIFRFIYGGHVASDTFIVILGVLVLGFIARTAEWRERLPAALGNKPLSP
jgi:hypothetical protein